MLMTRSEYERMVEIADGWAKVALDIADEFDKAKANLREAKDEIASLRARLFRQHDCSVYSIKQPMPTHSPFGTFWSGPYSEVV